MGPGNIIFDFSDKRALVIGGSSGIGRGVVDSLLAAGAAVTYASRSKIEGDCKAKFIKTDITKQGEVEALFTNNSVSEGLDILINSAAITYSKKINQIGITEWDEVTNLNLRALFLVCKLAANLMVKQKSGRIVNISSIAGRHRSLVAGVHYVSSKAGVIGLTKQLAFELGPSGINVNVVCPSQTLTPMLQEAMSLEEKEGLARSIPLQRIANISDQVGPILFLCSDAAKYITGAVLDVNGGQI